MHIERIASAAMALLERSWTYYCRDWGRLRCHFCGHADGGYGDGPEHIVHSKDCRYLQLKDAFDEHQKTAVVVDEDDWWGI